MSGPSETNVQNENTSVDFVYKRFKAKLHRQSTALVKGFPTPPSSCPTDTGLLRSVYLPFVDPRKKLCSSPHPYECVRKHTLLAAHTRVFVCPPVATLREAGQPQTYVTVLKCVFRVRHSTQQRALVARYSFPLNPPTTGSISEPWRFRRRTAAKLKTIVNFVYKKIQIANSSPITRARRELSNALTPVVIAHAIQEICSLKPWPCPTGRNALPFSFRTALHRWRLMWTSPSNQVTMPRYL